MVMLLRFLICCFPWVPGLVPAQQTSSATVPAAPAVASVDQVSLPGIHPSAPQWSPDGQWLSFSGPKGNGIGLVKPDGTGMRWLTREPGSGFRHAWAPDSTRVVCRARTATTGLRQYAILTLSIPDGHVESRVEVDRNALPPFWQHGPEGIRWISQSSSGPPAGPWLPCPALPSPEEIRPPLLSWRNQQLGFPALGDGFQPLVPGRSQDPHWNAAGDRVVFDAADRIACWDGTSPQAMVLCPGQQPAFSPEGHWIAYQVTRDHTHAPEDPAAHTASTLPHLHDDRTNHQITEADLWVIRPDGTGASQLTATPDILEVEPAWSPDGRSLICRIEGAEGLTILRLKEVSP